MNNKKHLLIDFDNKAAFELNRDCKGPECNKCGQFSKKILGI